MKVNLSKFFQLRFNVMLFRLMSYSCCYAYMQLIGRLYYLIRRREKHLIERNVRDLLRDRSEQYIREKTKLAFKGIFDHYF